MADVGVDGAADDAVDEDAAGGFEAMDAPEGGAEVDETSPEDVGLSDASPEEVGLSDASPEEVGLSDASPEDVSSGDSAAEDTSPDVAEPDDTGSPAPGPPLIGYSTGGPRRLFFLNNPEQLLTTELGDADLMDATLLRVTADGPSRSFFEHLNRSGRTLGFGIQAYNPGPDAAHIVIEGEGFTVGIEGGRPFAQALSNQGARTLSLAAGQAVWLMRRDELIPHGAFFSGVLDFTVQGQVTVNHIAYDRFDRLDGSTAERDYVTRVEPDGTPEARMYKGVASASEAELNLALVIDRADSGPLAVRVRPYDLEAQRWGEVVEATHWVSHIGPSQNAASSVTDMVSFAFRSWTFDPLVRSDGAGRYPNLGNWGVVYRTRVELDNRDSRPRTVTWRVWASPGAGAGLAKRAGVGSAEVDPRGGWTAHQLAPGGALDVTSVTIPPGGRGTLYGALVLGGPSGGALRNALVAD